MDLVFRLVTGWQHDPLLILRDVYVHLHEAGESDLGQLAVFTSPTAFPPVEVLGPPFVLMMLYGSVSGKKLAHPSLLPVLFRHIISTTEVCEKSRRERERERENSERE